MSTADNDDDQRTLTSDPFSQRRTVIVCARHVRSAATLRRIFAERHDISIVETRNLPAAERELIDAPDAALVVTVYEAWLDRLFDRLPKLFGSATSAQYPRVRCFAIVPDRLAVYRLPLREAGVTDLIPAPQELTVLAPSILRHFEQTPPNRLPLEDRIMAALPWR